MVRSLATDELAWFVRQSLTFIGHSDPNKMALALTARLRDPRVDAKACHVLVPPDAAPTAGVHVTAPDADDDARAVVLASPWYHGDARELASLVSGILERVGHESVTLRLDAVPASRQAEMTVGLRELGFTPDSVTALRFDLTDVPPLGAPLLLESWTQGADKRFRQFLEDAEGRLVSDAGWAHLKRKKGPFQPNLWFLARATLDQDPVGYAFCGATARKVDATFTLDAVGVARGHRASSEMLRRLVITTLQELSVSSPLGSVEAEVSSADAKLADILRSVGFAVTSRSAVLVKRPS